LTDLDDTLWRGTIGEGDVDHYRDRQQTLKELRLKGLLLGIVSRNDPRNVHWTNGVLQSSDFVAEQIQLGPQANEHQANCLGAEPQAQGLRVY